MSSFVEDTIGYDTATFALCIFLWYIILLPVLFYYLHHYHENKEDPFIRTRNPQLSLIANYFLMVLLFIIAPIQWAEIIYFESYNFGKLREYLLIIRVVWEQLSMWLRLIRYWHLWFKYKYQKHRALSVYIKAINIDANKSNYFVRHKHTFGSLKFLYFIVLIVWCIQIIFCIFILLIFQHKHSYNVITSIAVLFYLFQCIVFVALSFTINKIQDKLYIRNEVFYESIVAAFSCLILLVILYFNYTNSWILSNKYFISLIMFVVPGFVCYPLMICITSLWVYSKMKHEWKMRDLRQKAIELQRFSQKSSSSAGNMSSMHALPSHSRSMTMASITSNVHGVHSANYSITETCSKLDIDDKIDPQLKHALSLSAKACKSSKSTKFTVIKAPFVLKRFLPNTVGFELFAEHLIKEYAVENLLFLVEVEKFKKHCKAKYGKKLSIERQKLPKSIPTSIDLKVFKNRLKLQFCVLYHKYIDSVKADLSVNVASRNRLICQQLYNEFYERAHGLNRYYDDAEYDEISHSVRTPRTPPRHKRFSSKFSTSALQKSSNSGSAVKKSGIKRTQSFPNISIGFRDRDKNNKIVCSQQHEEEQKTLKETRIDDIKEGENENDSEVEQSTNSKTISILPPLNMAISSAMSKNNDNNKLSVSQYIKYSSLPVAQKQQRLSITPTPTRGSYPPHLTINVNEHSLEREREQLTTYDTHGEITDNEETPAPPMFLPQMTPQGTPLPDNVLTKFTQNVENLKNDENTQVVEHDNSKSDETPQTTDTLSALAPSSVSHSLEPLTPLSLSPPISRRHSHELVLSALSALPDEDTSDEREEENKEHENEAEAENGNNLTVKKILSIDSVASQSITSASVSTPNCKVEDSVFSNTITVGSESVTNTSSNSKNSMRSHYKSSSNVNNEWSVDVPDSPNTPNIKISSHVQYNSTSFDGDHDTPIPNDIDNQYPSIDLQNKKRRKNSRRSLRSLQKRTSASLLHLANRVPRNILNQRIDEMMFLMDRKEKNSKAAKQILRKYVDDLYDIESIIDALDNCLKDVVANLRDSFGRFVFTDAYKRWSGDE